MYLVYENKIYSFILHIVETVNLYIGVKPLNQQIAAYEKVFLLNKMFLWLCSILKNIEWNGIIKIDN